MNNYTTDVGGLVAPSVDVPELSDPCGTVIPGFPPSGDTRCPAWCADCSPGMCHRTASIEVDLGDATASVSLSQWRNGYPDDLLPGWKPARITVSVVHKTETIDFGFEDCQPVIIRASDPQPLGVIFGAPPDAIRRFIEVQQHLLALLAEDGGVGDV